METPFLNTVEKRVIRAERAGVLFLLAGAFCFTGLVFIADAGWRWLAEAYDPVIASVVVGALMLVLSLLCVIIHLAGSGRATPQETETPPQPQPSGAAAQLIEAFLMGLDAARTMRRS